MPDTTLKTAIATYPHTKALKDGSVKPEGIALDHVEVTPIIAAFRRMIRNMEFDISEMAISTYFCARAYGKPITAIPVFPLRSFQHGGIVYNTKSGVQSPKDLEGRKVGVRAYTVTGGVWARGILKDEYGVDLDRITWVVNDEEHVAEYPDQPNVEKAIGQDLAKMLVDGEIDAAIGVGRVDDPNVKPLIANARDAAVQSAKRTGVYPINHTVVIQDRHLQAHPEFAVALFEAFRQSKAAAPADEELAKTGEALGTDPVPYGLAKNRATLEAIARYNVEQRIIPKPISIEEAFANNTLGLE
jgi:4,5-dihydroxyphthalate decarboxylase